MVTELEPRQVDAFLEPGGTGVLALARDDQPYAIPVSYGYDPGERVFFLRLGFTDGDEKREFLGTRNAARLVVTEETGGSWTSVIAEGTLREVLGDEVTPRLADRLRRAAQPLLGMWDEPPGDVEFHLYVLDPDTVSGRSTGVSA